MTAEDELRDPELQNAVEALLHAAGDRKYCPWCTRMVRNYGHATGCKINALNTILNSRVPRLAADVSAEPK